MKYTKEKIKIQQLPSGDNLHIFMYKFTGKGDKKIYIQANIHGPELTGILVIKKLIQFFKLNQANFSELILIPSVNPIGLNQQFIGQQVGYVNHLSGKNWNRIYPDISKNILLKHKVELKEFKAKLLTNLEYLQNKATNIETLLGLKLLKYSFDSDIVIDLHTAWGKAPHYIYCYPEQLESAKLFQVENFILLDEKDFFGVFDEANLYPYFKNKQKIKKFKLPKEVFTLELGNDCDLNSENIQKSTNHILKYLYKKGIIKDTSNKSKFNPAYKYTISKNKDFEYYYAPIGGLLVWKIEDGDFFMKRDVIGEIFTLDHEFPTKLIAPKSGKLIIKGNSHSVHQGQAICKYMTNFKISSKK